MWGTRMKTRISLLESLFIFSSNKDMENLIKQRDERRNELIERAFEILSPIQEMLGNIPNITATIVIIDAGKEKQSSIELKLADGHGFPLVSFGFNSDGFDQKKICWSNPEISEKLTSLLSNGEWWLAKYSDYEASIMHTIKN